MLAGVVLVDGAELLGEPCLLGLAGVLREPDGVVPPLPLRTVASKI